MEEYQFKTDGFGESFSFSHKDSGKYLVTVEASTAKQAAYLMVNETFWGGGENDGYVKGQIGITKIKAFKGLDVDGKDFGIDGHIGNSIGTDSELWPTYDQINARENAANLERAERSVRMSAHIRDQAVLSVSNIADELKYLREVAAVDGKKLFELRDCIYSGMSNGKGAFMAAEKLGVADIYKRFNSAMIYSPGFITPYYCTRDHVRVNVGKTQRCKMCASDKFEQPDMSIGEYVIYLNDKIVSLIGIREEVIVKCRKYVESCNLTYDRDKKESFKYLPKRTFSQPTIKRV